MLKGQFSKYQDSKQPLFKMMAKKKKLKKQKKNKTKMNFQNEKKWKKTKKNWSYYFLEPGRQ